MEEGGSRWFTSWKWFDVSFNEEENSHGKVLYRWGEGVALDKFIDWVSFHSHVNIISHPSVW